MVNALSVAALRAEAVESSHIVSAAVVTDDGRPVAWCGRPDRPTHLRSAAKPFQAIPLVRDGAADQFAITEQELALVCASHNGEPRHVEIVRGLLERIGYPEQALVCGPHVPLSVDLAVRPPGVPRARSDAARGGVYSNCSGKHAGMAALAVHRGWSVTGYERPDHPVQQRCKRELALWTDQPEARLRESVDGCGVVCFSAPLDAVALAFAKLGRTADPPAVRIRKAMMSWPELVAGRYRLCTELMQAYPGEVLAKVGAEGVYGAALPGKGLGIALKVEDGSARAAMVALLAVLDELGLQPSPREVLARFAEMPLRNTRGEPVGALHATGSLTFA